MIFCFSGTGNSRYAAEKIAEVTGDSVRMLNETVTEYGTVDAGGTVVFAVPTYAWRIPEIVREWILRTEFQHAEKAWFVMTCGGSVGNAGAYNRRLCEQKGFSYMGTAQIVMPENYIAMFDVPGPEEAREIVAGAEPVIRAAAERIRDGRILEEERVTPAGRIQSSLINPLFYRTSVKADAFRTDERCTGCGACERLCPLGNIRISDGKPVWGKNCTHCMACICRCPQEAVEYGKKSAGKPRYHLG